MVFRQLSLNFSNSPVIDAKTALGQYMTPPSIAGFMADLFTGDSLRPIHLLDPGGGKGSLTSAFLEKWGEHVATCTACEIDDLMRYHFSKTLEQYSQKYHFQAEILAGDFVEQAVDRLLNGAFPQFTHVIMNPPYKKISSNSNHRLWLREVGIEAVNLYSAFVALAILLLQPQGQIVAIIPRSFCNGPYYKSFRQLILKTCSIKHLHLFESRKQAFRDDNVLQENIILLLVKGERQGRIIISSSKDSRFDDYREADFSFNEIVDPGDPEQFFRFPTSNNSKSLPTSLNFSLKELGINVCTGPVVDFRMKQYWQAEPTADSVPLLYGSHFSDGHFCWPKSGKKPNALLLSQEVEKWLMPAGNYVLVKRFSSKEEKRRVVAYLLNSESLEYPRIGFENHLNVFHQDKHGLNRDLAAGLYIYLNSTIIDAYFRVFSGHTQVNATDLRNLKYPSLKQLENIGRLSMGVKLNQRSIDKMVERIL